MDQPEVYNYHRVRHPAEIYKREPARENIGTQECRKEDFEVLLGKVRNGLAPKANLLGMENN